MINTGVPYYATHRDTTFPSEEGPLPDIGTILAMLETTTGVSPTFIFGKPKAAMLDAVRQEGTRAVMIGDRLETDRALAIGNGLDFVCVLTGDTNRRDLEGFREEAWPTVVVPSVASLIHPPAR
jgi:ribonucleotide monophosphatase NagD (HAD superfamily)